MRSFYIINVNIYLRYTVFRVYMKSKNNEKTSGLSQSIKHPNGNNVVIWFKMLGLNIFIGFINQLNYLIVSLILSAIQHIVGLWRSKLDLREVKFIHIKFIHIILEKHKKRKKLFLKCILNILN